MYIPLEDGEEIVLKVHRHWWFIALRIIGLCMMALLPLVLYALVRGLGILEFVGNDAVAVLTLGALWALVLWAFFWQFWTTYYMDIWVVTNRRIIDIDYRRLFDRNIAILRLDRVQDVTTHVSGILPSLLKFGSVVVQTAGSDKQFLIDQIAHPEALRDAISKVAGEAAERMRTVKLQS